MNRSLVSLLLAALLCAALAAQALAEPLRIGVLPVPDAMPLHVAVSDGLFRKEGLDVELVPFQSALERDMAAQAGRIDGYFGDLVAAFLLLRSGVPMPAVLVVYRTNPGHPMFALVTSPQRSRDNLAGLRGASLGLSNATVIEFLLDRIQAAHKLPRGYFNHVEVKKFPLRLQMLAAGQIDLALLPEPLVSLNVRKGGAVVATDENLDLPLTVVCLHQGLAPRIPAFLAAYAKAVARLDAEPEAYRILMAEVCALPAPLVASFPVPPFPAPLPPTRAELDTVQDWMIERGLLQQRIPYERSVLLRP